MDLRRIGFTTLIVLVATVVPTHKSDLLKFMAVRPVWAETQDGRKIKAERLNEQGIQQRQHSQYEAALQSFQQALRIYRGIHNRQGEAKALGNLGIVYENLGEYQQAIAYQQQFLAIARAIHNRQGEAKALGNLGIVYENLGEYQQAIAYQQQFLAIARAIHNRQSEAIALGNLGIVYENLGEYQQAIAYQQQFLAIARAIHNRQSEAIALRNLAIATTIQDRHTKAVALNNLGLALYESGKFSAAEQPLLQSIEVSECLRAGLKNSEQVTIFETQQSAYSSLQEVEVGLHKTDAALEIAERGRARAFVELLSNSTSLVNPDSACTGVKPLPLTIQQIEQTARTQNATLVEYSIVSNQKLFIWVVSPTGQVSFRSARLEKLDMAPPAPDGVVPPQSNRGEQEVEVAEIVRGTLAAVGVKGRGAAMTAPNRQEESKRLHSLCAQLIQPIEDLLPRDENSPVIFIPQGALFRVPFAALQDRQGKSLIETHTILTAPSIQVLALIRQNQESVQRTGLQEVLVVGNPTMPQVTISPGKLLQPPLQSLPGAEQEAKQIASLFKTQPLTGKEANKKVVMQKMEQSRVIHLATHGLLDDLKGLGVPGAIALAPDGTHQPNDGLLTADDILKMNLKAELVVLSACDTGQGTITGDGVIGLSRSLISAGTPDVVVSLWKVPDKATAELMTEFYRQWTSNRSGGKARALRAAMLATQKKYPDPLSWAGFSLIGEAR